MTVDLLALLEGVKRVAPNQWTARCSALDHDDRQASLSVSIGDDGRWLVHCHVGCSLEAIVAGVGLEVRDLFARNGAPWGNTSLGQAVTDWLPDPVDLERYANDLQRSKTTLEAIYELKGWRPGGLAALGIGLKGDRLTIPMRTLDGELVNMLRYWPAARPKMLSLKGHPRVPLYALLPDRVAPVWIVEGETDAIAMVMLGLEVIGAPGASTKPKPEWLAIIEGRDVLVCFDVDDAGRKAGVRWAVAALEAGARRVKIVELEGAKGYDVGELVLEHRDDPDRARAVLLGLADAASVLPLPQDDGERGGFVRPRDSWPPPLDRAAYYGLAGRIVTKIEPHTEADPVAVLISLLVMIGNAAGRDAHVSVEADRHAGAEYVVLVGSTSSGRKGTATGQARRLAARADEEWAKSRIVSGLSSGEGLIEQVRDEVSKKGVDDEGETVIKVIDEGIADKRLLVLEAEFASVLKTAVRQGNTLSPIVRLAWDGATLQTLTRHSPLRAETPHVSIIGQITPSELRRELNSSELANGFANRFLFVLVRRSKLLPDGGDIGSVDFGADVAELETAINQARTTSACYRRDEEARALWRERYADLVADRPGQLGNLLARGPAHVLRLALIYAVLDKTTVIRAAHLRAALAVWDYAAASVQVIFGRAIGDPVADQILDALRNAPDGLTRNQLRDVFGRHKSSDRIGLGLGALLDLGFVRVEHEQTGGRSAERWFYCAESAESAQRGES